MRRLRQAQLNLSYTRITAPIDGRVSSAAVTQGNFVQGAQGGGTVLTTIVALDPIRFVFEASETNYLRYSRAAAQGGQAPPVATHAIPSPIKLSDETRYRADRLPRFRRQRDPHRHRLDPRPRRARQSRQHPDAGSVRAAAPAGRAGLPRPS